MGGAGVRTPNFQTCAECKNDLVCHDQGECLNPAPDYGEPWIADERPQHDAIFTNDSTPLCLMFRKGGFSQRAADCVSACAGMADPAKEIAAMREAIREAHTALDGCLKYMLGVSVCNLDLECETMDDAHHALAKLQPFLK